MGTEAKGSTVNKTWQEYRDFHFNWFVCDIYRFQLTPEQQNLVKDETSEIYKRFILAADAVFARTKEPALRLTWAGWNTVVPGRNTLQKEINEIIMEIDQHAGI